MKGSPIRGSSLAGRAWQGSGEFAKLAPEPATPLAAWLWAAAFAALVVTAFFYAAGQVAIPRSQAFAAFNRERADAFASASRPDELRVVLIGNSRVKYGTLDEAGLSGLAADLGYGSMRFLRLVNNWAVFEDFAALEDAILAARPHVVVIQTELLAQERAERARALLLRDYAEWLAFGRGLWNPGDVDQAELQYDTPCAHETAPNALRERERRVRRWLRLQPDGASAGLARAFVGRASAQGATVVLLDVPRTTVMEAAKAAANSDIEATASLLIAAQPGVRLLEPAGPPDQLYCDLVHMDEDGRRAFSARLVAALASLAHPSP
jgi:hypothetical protein